MPLSEKGTVPFFWGSLTEVTKQAVEKSIEALESEINRAVGVVMELKKKGKKWQQQKTEIEKKLKNLLKRVEELSGEKED